MWIAEHYSRNYRAETQSWAQMNPLVIVMHGTFESPSPRCCSSVAQSCLTLCNPMNCSTPGFPVLHHLPRACSNSCPLSQGCHPTISYSVIPFSFCLWSFPASGSFPMSWFFTSGGQSIGASALVIPKNIQGWFPLGFIGLISWQSKGLWRVHLLEDTFNFNPAFIIL